MKNLLLIVLFFEIISPQSFCQYNIKNAFPNLSFNQPVDFQDPRDGTNRAFVVTQEGIIYVFQNDSSVISKKVFLDIRNKLISGGEMGLLGLAFHPDFKNNGYFFVDYTAPNPLHSVITRYSVDPLNPDAADTNSGIIILQVDQPYQNHNAGQLAFGQDGYLYIGFGDGGSAGDPQNNAQNLSSLLGKMLRIDINKTDNGINYSIPGDNPFAGNLQNWREEIWAYGLRNPWRYSFDPVNGLLWVGDVGQDAWEEVDILNKGDNYGWRKMEGFHCYNPSNCDTTGLILPVWEYGHNSSGGNSITGGYVYRGSVLPQIYGKYIYGDYVSGRIWALSYDGKNPATNQLLLESGLNISSFGVDKDKNLFICAFDGNIYKFNENTTSSVSSEKISEFGLDYNFPNPFNSNTTFTIHIKNEGKVLLEIYNTIGEKISTLINKVIPTGIYEFNWNAGNLPSGIYICRMTVNNFYATRKIILQK
jgi:glucose/arabinose dehydrogenase